MKTAKLDTMIRGWFIGNFSPTLCNTNAFEAGVKHFAAGEREETHYHAIATEYTVIVFGKVRMNGQEYTSGDIIIMEPGEATDFYCEEAAVTAIIKIPSVQNDKFIIKK